MQSVGTAIAVLFFAALAFNAAVMLISPRRWFDLPPYLGFQGTMRRAMLSTPGGRIQIRTAGSLMLILIAWIVATVLGNDSKPPHSVVRHAPRFATPTPYTAVCVAICMVASAAGALMALRPYWWFQRYFKPRLHEEHQYQEAVLARVIRILGLVLLAAGFYLAWLSL